MSQFPMHRTPLRDSVRLHTALPTAGPDPLIGLAVDDRPLTLDPDQGHLLVATGAGGGTTTVLRSLAAQALARGARADFLDLRHAEHAWAHGLPDSRHLTNVAAIHDHLLLTANALREQTPVLGAGWASRHVLVIEELSTLVAELRQYWTRTRPETQLEEAPGVEALELLLQAGRAYGVTVLAGDAGGTIPGSGAHGPAAFATRILGHVSWTTWRRAAADAPAPPYSEIPGRLHLVTRDTKPTSFQALHLTSGEARALAAPESAGRARRECA
ncbi:cell division protein FtsK [Streptomyces sp. NPDC090741]|uniref:cell division protein FtsK n=1 Tax=Streptomyces sp. NPDC090741 TaxID=3365967 RepID=UPI00382CF4C0